MAARGRKRKRFFRPERPKKEIITIGASSFAYDYIAATASREKGTLTGTLDQICERDKQQTMPGK